jgi:hypothetical protein
MYNIFLKGNLEKGKKEIFVYETCVSQVEGGMQSLWKAVLCCMCKMLVLMTLQCLCPVITNRYDRELKKGFYVRSALE